MRFASGTTLRAEARSGGEGRVHTLNINPVLFYINFAANL